jgi:DNA modification methylase
MPCGKKIGPFDCCSIVCGNQTELLKLVPDRAAGLILSDIPFNVGFDYGDTYDDNVSDDDYGKRCSEWFTDWRRVAWRSILKVPKAHLPIVIQPFADRVGYAWTIVQSSPNSTSHGFTQLSLYSIFLVSKGIGPKPITDLFVSTNNKIETEHPAEMPVAPLVRLIRDFSTEGALVIDPFCGSGSTLAAALRVGRHYLGIDISESYCNIARARLSGVTVEGAGKDVSVWDTLGV